MEDDSTVTPAYALRTILKRRALRVWAAKSAQERDALADDIQQLFSSPSAIGATVNGSTTTTVTTNATTAAAPRAVTRRPGVEEVKNCILSSVYASLPPQCSALRSEIWQVLLNVYKRNQHGASAQEFDRMILRLGKLPRDPVLVDESAHVSTLLATDRDEQLRIQRELEILLVWFLTTKSVAYTRGMARAVAPFFLLDLPLPTIYDCFYQYCASFLPHLITFDDAGAATAASGMLADTSSETVSENATTADASDTADCKIRERQLLVEQLVSYHDPQLAHVLAQWCSSEWSRPDHVIPAGFFTGDLHETLAPRVHTFVIDQLLLTGDTLFSAFVLLALLLHARDALLACTSAADVLRTLAAAVAVSRDTDAHVQFLCLYAARLRSRTPRSYKCGLHVREGTTGAGSGNPTESVSASRLAADIAFGVTNGATAAAAPPSSSSSSSSALSDKREPVDMTQWVKKESRSIAGKIFWYHTQTGTTQWEHPAEKHEPAPALFALPISVHEVASQVMGERTAVSSGSSSSGNGTSSTGAAGVGASGLHFFVVDCRGLRSSEDLKSGRIPAAYTLDPSVFDSPDLIAKNMEALNPLQSQVHIVLVGHGVGMPPELVTTDELKTSVRDAVRHDSDALNRAALFFQKRGFRFVSVLDGGYASWHAFMRDAPACSPHELLNHVADECHYCRYDTILRTGEDPLKKKQQQQAYASRFRRKKSSMPTTTDLPVNGGEGDASIVSTSSAYNNRASSAAASLSQIGSGAGNRMSLTLSRNSISSMRTKLADVKMPKLQWGRRSSATSSAGSAPPSGTNPHGNNDSGSSSETATVDDGGSDRGSSATDDLEDKPDELFGSRLGGHDGDTVADSADEDTDDAAALEALQAKLEAQVSPSEHKKSFVGVFTIDYSDDEDADVDASVDVDVVTIANAAPTASA